MGRWFMATALGNLMAGLIAGESTSASQGRVNSGGSPWPRAASQRCSCRWPDRCVAGWRASVDGFFNDKQQHKKANT